MSLLASGILDEPSNAKLKAALFSGALQEEAFGHQLQIRLLQMLAWCVGEYFGAVPSRLASPESRAEYHEKYAFCRLCLAVPRAKEKSAQGLGAKVMRVLNGLWQGDTALAIAPFHSALFNPSCTSDIADARLSDSQAQALLTTVHDEIVQTAMDDAHGRPDVQVLGRVHEWLLQLRPFVNRDKRTIAFDTAPGHERRATGSYFTPPDLVDDLVEHVIEPQLEERVSSAKGEQARAAVLSLRVVDPACGTGVFLLAAARKIAAQLSQLRGASARENEQQTHVRSAIKHCIYGVDIGETTAHLCRLALWFEMGPPFDASPELDAHVLCGNSVFGAWPELLALGMPDIAFTPSPSDDRRVARVLKARNRGERRQSPLTEVSLASSEATANLWCSSFVWPKVQGELVPTHSTYVALAQDGKLPPELSGTLQRLTSQFRFFHWHWRFADVFAAGSGNARQPGFDVVIGNPPWVAHAGRSTQSLPFGLKNCLIHSYSSFSGYPTTHGAFVELGARLLAVGGRLGLIVPASVADLDGYAATRAAHDERCELGCPLPDYGEGRFTGVTQPCVALVSRRTPDARPAAERGRPWPLVRTDLDATGSALLARWARLRPFPPEMFGEKGFQSTPTLREHVQSASGPGGRFSLPLREGSDVREFQLGGTRLYADPGALQGILRPLSEFAQVELVVRQTARYPIAARNDGLAFRNSLLAVLRHADWHWALLLCLLNSSLFRWTHFHRYRDGRQPILPQLKVGHLRSLPAPVRTDPSVLSELEELGMELASRNQGILDSERELLDAHVAALYELSADEHSLVTAWHSHRPR